MSLHAHALEGVMHALTGSFLLRLFGGPDGDGIMALIIEKNPHITNEDVCHETPTHAYLPRR